MSERREVLNQLLAWLAAILAWAGCVAVGVAFTASFLPGDEVAGAALVGIVASVIGLFVGFAAGTLTFRAVDRG